MENDKKKESSGGMYRGMQVPIKLLDSIIVIGIMAILFVTVFAGLK